MRLANFEFENIICFNNKANVLVIENATKYYQYCNMLLTQWAGEEGLFVLSENYKELNFQKEVFIIPNLFDIDNYDKRLISKLYTELNLIINENLFQEFNELNAKIIHLLEKLSFDCDFSLDYDTVLNINSLLKMQKVNFLKEKNNFLEKLIDYISAINKYLKPKLLVVFGLKTVLNNEDLDEFYKFIYYNSIKLLSIEAHQASRRKDENILLIDNDLCELTF